MTQTQLFRATLPDTWEQIIDQRFDGVVVRPGFFTPIPSISFPFVFTEELLVVGVTSESALPHWTFAGNLYQQYSIPDIPGIPIEANQTTLRLGGFRLLRSLLVVPQYTLFLTVPNWLQDITVTVWRHTRAADTPLAEQLNSIQTQITSIENSLNAG